MEVYNPALLCTQKGFKTIPGHPLLSGPEVDPRWAVGAAKVAVSREEGTGRGLVMEP